MPTHAVCVVQVKCGLVFAVLLNRLSANTMPDTWKPQAWRGRTTSVKVSAKSPTITSPGGLMRAITDELGAHVQMKVVNRVTSFGQGPSLHACILLISCVRQQESNCVRGTMRASSKPVGIFWHIVCLQRYSQYSGAARFNAVYMHV